MRESQEWSDATGLPLDSEARASSIGKANIQQSRTAYRPQGQGAHASRQQRHFSLRERAGRIGFNLQRSVNDHKQMALGVAADGFRCKDRPAIEHELVASNQPLDVWAIGRDRSAERQGAQAEVD